MFGLQRFSLHSSGKLAFQGSHLVNARTMFSEKGSRRLQKLILQVAGGTFPIFMVPAQLEFKRFNVADQFDSSGQFPGVYALDRALLSQVAGNEVACLLSLCLNVLRC